MRRVRALIGRPSSGGRRATVGVFAEGIVGRPLAAEGFHSLGRSRGVGRPAMLRRRAGGERLWGGDLLAAGACVADLVTAGGQAADIAEAATLSHEGFLSGVLCHWLATRAYPRLSALPHASALLCACSQFRWIFPLVRQPFLAWPSGSIPVGTTHRLSAPISQRANGFEFMDFSWCSVLSGRESTVLVHPVKVGGDCVQLRVVKVAVDVGCDHRGGVTECALRKPQVSARGAGQGCIVWRRSRMVNGATPACLIAGVP